MTEFQTQKRKLEEQICKMAYNKSRITVGVIVQRRLSCQMLCGINVVKSTKHNSTNDTILGMPFHTVKMWSK